MIFNVFFVLFYGLHIFSSEDIFLGNQIKMLLGRECFSYFNVHMNQLEEIFKMQTDFDSVCLNRTWGSFLASSQVMGMLLD